MERREGAKEGSQEERKKKEKDKGGGRKVRFPKDEFCI